MNETTHTSTYAVSGMTCGGCAGSVTEGIREVAGVQDVAVDLATGSVTVTSAEPLDATVVRAAVEAAGYQIA